MNAETIFLTFIALPLVASPVVYLVGRISIRKGKLWGISLARALTVLFLLVEGCLLFLSTRSAIATGGVYTDIGEVSMVFDGVGLLVCVVVIFLGLMVSLFSISYMQGERGEEKFFALLLITIGSIIGLSLSFDLFNLWIWFELMAISTYFLVAFYNDQPTSLEAGMKYLAQSAIGSAFVLFGIALLFSQTGSTGFADFWQTNLEQTPLAGIAGILIIIGFGVKAALVPLHTWLPDAHSQAPSGISAMLSGVVIEAGLIALLRTLSMLGKVDVSWGAILLGFGCLNILIGNLMALRQSQIKRLLAYSSLAHIGYMLLGFGFGFAFASYDGLAGGFFHLITHSLMKGLAFLAAGALLYALHLSRGDHKPLVLDDLNGASRKYPIIAFALSAAVLGLGGLPPLAGFMSKWQILIGGASSQNNWMLAVVIFAGLNSVLSLGYYAPVVNRLYRRETSEVVAKGHTVPILMVIPIVIMTAAILLLGVWPSLMDFLTDKAGLSLLYTFFN